MQYNNWRGKKEYPSSRTWKWAKEIKCDLKYYLYNISVDQKLAAPTRWLSSTKVLEAAQTDIEYKKYQLDIE